MIAAGVLAAMAAPASAASYVAYDQFQLVDGAVQTGDFAVGYFTGPFAGTATAYPATQAQCSGNPGIFCVRNGEASVAKAVAGTYDPPGTLVLPGGLPQPACGYRRWDGRAVRPPDGRGLQLRRQLPGP